MSGVVPLIRAVHSGLSPSLENPNDGLLEDAPEIQRGSLDRNTGTLPLEIYAVAFFGRERRRRGSLAYAVTVSGAGRAVERFAVFDPGGIIFFDLQFFPLCEIRPKAADAQIPDSEVVTRKNNTRASVP